jgi:hypothetical protein
MAREGLRNTDVPTLSVDRAMRIKLFTPSSARLFNLRPSDVERPLAAFSPKTGGGILTPVPPGWPATAARLR